MAKRYCASCRAGENKVEADYMVKGIRCDRWGEDRMPYRAYLCDEHLTMMLDDGAELDIVEYVSEQARNKRAKDLVENYTGYEGVKNFLASNPTLQKRSFEGVEFLRVFYKERTGKDAFAG